MKIIVPVSGGKDSTATLIKAIKTGKKVIGVFNDTGWEHPKTYKYLKYLKKKTGIKIHTTKGHLHHTDLETIIKNYGKFPFGLGRFCTTTLKQRATREWYKSNIYREGKSVQFWYGIRQAESQNRAKKYEGITEKDEFEMNDVFPGIYNKVLSASIVVKFPIITWKEEEEVFAYLESNGIKANPLYFEGTNNRVGCYPCLIAGKKVQNKMFDTKFGQKQLKRIKELEKVIGKKYEMIDTGYCEMCNI